MFSTQSNTRTGAVPKIAQAQITGGRLVKLHTDGRVAPVAAANDRAMYLATHDAAAGEVVECIPLSGEGQIRVRAGTVSGTQNAGVAVYLAAAPAADGRINEVSSSATKIGYAEEPFVTDQLVLVRPISPT